MNITKKIIAIIQAWQTKNEDSQAIYGELIAKQATQAKAISRQRLIAALITGDLASVKKQLFIYPSNALSKMQGNSLLHLAIYRRQYDILQMLLQNNDVVWDSNNCLDTLGRTPLHIACLLGDNKAAEIILNSSLNLIDAKDLNGRTALHYIADRTIAADQGHTWLLRDKALTKSLLRHKANINVEDKEKNTPLHLAAARGSKLFFINLLAKNAVNINAQNTQGETPLHAAFKHAVNKKTALLLIEKGADLTCVNKQGKPPITTAMNKLAQTNRTNDYIESGLGDTLCPVETLTETVVDNIPMIKPWMNPLVMVTVLLTTLGVFSVANYQGKRMARSRTAQTNLALEMYLKHIDVLADDVKTSQQELMSAQTKLNKRAENIDRDMAGNNEFKVNRIAIHQQTLIREQQKLNRHQQVQQNKLQSLQAAINAVPQEYFKVKPAWQKLTPQVDINQVKAQAANYTDWKDKLLAFTIACGKGICFGSGIAGVSAMAIPIPLVGWVVAGVGITVSVITAGVITYKAYHTALGEMATKNINQHLLINKLNDKKQAFEHTKGEHKKQCRKLFNQIQNLNDQLTQTKAQVLNPLSNKLYWRRAAKLKSSRCFFTNRPKLVRFSTVSPFRLQ